MRILPRVRSWFRNAFRRSRMEDEMEAELRFHVDAYAKDLLRSGAGDSEALRQARLAFGSVAAQKEECRASVGLRLWDELCADVRYGSRILRQSPVFTAVALLSLALGIGANTAIFALAEDVLLKSLPVEHSGELKLLSWVSGPHPMIHDTWGSYAALPAGGYGSTSFSYPVFQALRRHNSVFESLVGFKDLGRLTATVSGAAEPVVAQLVSGDFYGTLGVRPEIGRPISPKDDDVTSPPVAVISDAYWKRRFAGTPEITGKQLVLNGTAVTIIGVNAPEFEGAVQGASPEVFLPIALQPQVYPVQFASSTQGGLLNNNEEFWLMIMGRLRPGVSEAKAQAALDVVFAQAMKQTLPENSKDDLPRIKLLTGSRGMDNLRAHFSQPVYVLLAASGVVLLLACVNLANLLLARASARGREIGIRAAMGASRNRIVRQVMTESMLLAVLGGCGGVLLGYWGRNVIPSWTHGSWDQSGIAGEFDLRVLGFSVGLCLLTGFLFGLAPAWHATQDNLSAGLKETTRTTRNRSKTIAGKLLVTFQISLAVLLVIGAGLFVRTLINLKSSFIGFEPQNVLLFSLDPPRSGYPAAKRIELFRQVEEKLTAVPGVLSVAVSGSALLSNSTSTTDFRADGMKGRAGAAGMSASSSSVGAGFFRTMGIRILAGRSFDAHDRANSQRVGVVNERLAKEFYSNTNPIGRTFTVHDKHIEIVGVCADTKTVDLRSDPVPTYYTPYLQGDDAGGMTFEVKTTASKGVMAANIRDVLRSLDRDLPLTDLRSQTEQIDDILLQEKLFARLTVGFGALALVLASIGIYGVMAYTVARRTNEIGIRMALGAQRLQVLRSVLREAAWLAFAGVAVGVGTALALTRLLKSMLYGLQPGDPATLLGAVLMMVAVALLAGFLPARRAANVDPMSALRHD